jgi:hypothetical protein
MSAAITTNEAIDILRFGGLDLAAGVTISTMMEYVFGEVSNEDVSLPNEFVKLFLQGFFTLFLAVEYRRSFFADTQSDPSAGIILIVTLFRQENFWKRVYLVKQAVLEYLFRYLGALNYQSGQGVTTSEQKILYQQKMDGNVTPLVPNPKMSLSNITL